MNQENSNSYKTPQQLGGLIQYQPDSVVSRTIIKKDAGTVTLFAFAGGQSLSTHSAPFDALVQIIDGQAKITVADKSYVVEAGEMLVMPQDIPHAVEAIGDMKMLLVMIKSAGGNK
jgi:quercetin dioxygenase-like cupin family protein